MIKQLINRKLGVMRVVTDVKGMLLKLSYAMIANFPFAGGRTHKRLRSNRGQGQANGAAVESASAVRSGGANHQGAELSAIQGRAF